MRNTQNSKDAMVYAKIPPHTLELETAVIGSCLNDNGREIFEEVSSLITDPKTFYKEEHQKIYAAMQRLYYKGSPIDMLLVSEELARTGELDIVGGAYGLVMIAGKVVSDAHVNDYAKIVYEKYLSRETIRMNAEMINAAYADTEDIFQLIEQASERYYQLTSTGLQREPKSAAQLGLALRRQLTEQRESPNDITCVSTGFAELNALTNGWQKTDLTVIAARPSGGKTAFALALALAALDDFCPTLIFSLEMGGKQLAARMVSCISELPLKRIIRSGEMNDQDWQQFEQADEDFSGYPLHVDDTAAINLFDMRAKVRRMKMKHDIGLVIVDYLQLMSGVGNEGNREQEISRISRGLKALAKDFDIPVIALSQLNRSIETAAGDSTRDPRLSDLRESGAIEQDADNVIFITNPPADMIAKDSYYSGKKLITIAKGRNIGLGKIFLEFNSDIQQWKTPEVF